MVKGIYRKVDSLVFSHPHLRSAWFFISILISALASLPIRAEDTPEGFVSLFDGKSLEGWEGDAKTFRVEGGAIVAGSLKERVPHNDFLCTRREYGDFELRFEAKLMGEGNNAGVQFRSQRVPNHFEVKGYQADMGAFGKDNVWGGLYDESRRNKFLATPDQKKLADIFRPGEWNQLRIRCEGPRIQIWVNELQTVDYTEAEAGIPRSGIIGLQIHGGAPAEASYRKLAIRELGAKSVN